MKRKTAERWLSMAMDGELSARRRAKLDAYLAADPSLAELRNEWVSIGDRYRTATVAPEQTPEAAWQDVRRAIRLQGETPRGERIALQSRMKWAGAVAAALLVMMGARMLLRAPDPSVWGAVAAADRTEVEWVETDLPDAMSMVYEDADTGLTVIWVLVHENGEEDGHAG